MWDVKHLENNPEIKAILQQNVDSYLNEIPVLSLYNKFSVIGDHLESWFHDQMPLNNCLPSIHGKQRTFNNFLAYNLFNL